MKFIKNLLCLCAGLALAGCVTTTATNPRAEARALEGNWKPVQGELAGRPMTEEVLKTISLKLDEGKYEVWVGKHPDRGTYTIDSKSLPKSITVTGTEGPNHGRTFPAIYEIHGDTLRICYDLSGMQRPGKFATLAGTRLFLVTYQRAKE